MTKILDYSVDLKEGIEKGAWSFICFFFLLVFLAASVGRIFLAGILLCILLLTE